MIYSDLRQRAGPYPQQTLPSGMLGGLKRGLQHTRANAYLGCLSHQLDLQRKTRHSSSLS